MNKRISGFLLIPAVCCAVVAVLFSAGSAAAADPQKPVMVLRVIPDQYGIEVAPGESKTLTLEIKNIGDRPLTGIKLSAENASGWSVTFNPASIDTINAGNFRDAIVTIIPDSKADRGNYDLTLVARSAEALESLHLYLRIEQSSGFWLWIGGAVAIVVVGLFAYIFIRSSRQEK